MYASEQRLNYLGGMNLVQGNIFQISLYSTFVSDACVESHS